MNNSFVPNIMPIIACAVLVVFMVLVIVAIVSHNILKQKQSEAIGQQAFEALVDELRASNAAIKSELDDVKTAVASIKEMMEAIQ